MSKAFNDLKEYANKTGLQIFEGRSEIATQLDIDEEDVPSGLTHIVTSSDGFGFNVKACLYKGRLSRLGDEDRGEDPDDIIPVTLQELLQMT